MDQSDQLPLQQHPGFLAAVRLLGAKTRVAQIEGAAPVQVIQRFGIDFASRGPVWRDSPERLDPKALRASGLRLLNSEGGDEALLKAAGFRRLVAPRQVAELSLKGSRETRMKRLKGKWRNAYRKAQASPHRVQREKFTPKRHMWLIRAEEEQQKAKGYRTLPAAFTPAFAQANPGQAMVFVAYEKAQAIAAMVVLMHGAVATYHMGWTSKAGRAQAAHNGLLMRAADYARAQGAERLDLGHLDLERAPGLARFKLGTGAEMRSLGGTWARLPFGLGQRRAEAEQGERLGKVAGAS